MRNHACFCGFRCVAFLIRDLLRCIAGYKNGTFASSRYFTLPRVPVAAAETSWMYWHTVQTFHGFGMF